MNNMIKNKARGGKKKREIKKIEDKSSRQITFSKRRVGVFSKARELCVLTGAEVVVLCESVGGRVYAFAHPSVESVVNRYLGDKSSSELLENNSASTETKVNSPPCMHDEMKKQYLELTKEIEIAKNKSAKVNGGINDDFNDNNINMEEGDLFWWQQPFEHLEEEELEEYISSMEELMNKLKLRANDMMLTRSFSSMFDSSDTLNSNDSGLSDENLADKNLKMKDYGSPHEFSANKNMTTMDYGLQDEFFANKNLTTKDYALMKEFFTNKDMTMMDHGFSNKYLANKNMTMMEYGLSDEFFVTTKDYGLPDEFFANKNLTTKDYGLPDEFFTNKNLATTDYGLHDEFFANNNLTTKDYALMDEFFAKKNMTTMDHELPDKYLANENMTLMEYGLTDEFFVTTKDYGLSNGFFANKNLTTNYGLPDEFFANKNPTTTDYVLPYEFSADRNLTTNDHGLVDEFFANKNMNVNGLLNEFLAIKDPNFNGELDDYFTDLELPLDYGNNLQVPDIGCNGTGNEVQLSQTDSNLGVPDNYGKATGLHNFGTDVFPDDFCFSCPPNN